MSGRYEEFAAEMDELGLRTTDLARLTGKDRRTVWRWRTGRSPVPEYAWTIMRLQRKVRQLVEESI